MEAVAAYAADPSHAPEWYVNIRSVEWETDPPVQVGSRMCFVAGKSSIMVAARSSSICSSNQVRSCRQELLDMAQSDVIPS